MLWIALPLIVLVCGGAIVWAAWRMRWIASAAAWFAATLATILLAQVIGGREPIGYGIALGLSIFIVGVMTMMGIIAALARRLDR